MKISPRFHLLLAAALPTLGHAMTPISNAPPANRALTNAAPVPPKNLQALAASVQQARLSKGRTVIPVGRSRNLKNFALARATTQTATKGDVIVTSDIVRGVTDVKPNPIKGKKSLVKVTPAQTPERAALDFVASRKDVFAIADADADLKLGRTEIDERGGAHLIFEQQLNGVPFWGRELAAHFNKYGELESINCLISTDAKTTKAAANPQATITSAEAITVAKGRFLYDGIAYDPPTGINATICKYTGPTAVLNFWQQEPGRPTHLVWVVEDRPNFRDWYRFFIDAGTGEILEYYNNTQADGPATANATNLLGQTKTIHTYQVGSTYYMIDASRPMFVAGQSGSNLVNDAKGCLVTLNLDNKPPSQSSQIFHFTSSNNTWSDPTSVSAQDYGAVAYEYYRQNHGRNSLDNKGGTIISVAHDDQGLDNAYWNGAAMLYGDGGSLFKPLARALDVAAHEMTHGVTQNTANLEYKNQSGALNESMSDVFGIIVDSDDYRIGEDVVKPASFPSGALRDLQDPHNGSNPGDNGWQPAVMNEFQQLSTDQDNGGVHVNSGIPNHAAYYIINAIGRTKAANIYYNALTSGKLLKQSNFSDCRAAMEAAAIEIYGNNSTEHNAVKTAYGNVGIGSAGTSEPPPDETPSASGHQYYLVDNDRTLYISPNGSLNTSTFIQLSNIPLNAYSGANYDVGSGKPYAIDPISGLVVFVGANTNLYSVNADASNPTTLSSDGGFGSVAFSPSGRKIALTPYVPANTKDNVIYVIDFGVSPPFASTFTLRHPTSAAGTSEDIVQRADTLDWLDDDLVIFDCFNVSGTGSNAMSYWDINILDTTTQPTSPTIFPLLPPLPEGVDVGNPVVSSLNGTIICFDYLDTSPASFVLSSNLYTGEVFEFIDLQPSDIAVCDYAPDDSKIYVSLGSPSGTTEYFCYSAPLSNDHLSITGDFQSLFSGGYLNEFAKTASTSTRGNLVEYLLHKSGATAPGVVDFNGDGRADAADIKTAPTN